MCIYVKELAPTILCPLAMPHSFLHLVTSAICVSLIVRSCFSASTAEPVFLRPLTISAQEKSSGLRPRDAHLYSRLDLQSQGQLIYGSPTGSVLPFKKSAKR